MRDINRIKPTIGKLEQLWLSNPDYRLGQLIMAIIKPEESNLKIYYMEDDVFLSKMEEFENTMKNINSK